MKFAKTVDGSIIAGTFEQLWPNTNANDRIDYALGHGFTPVTSDLTFDPVFEQLVPSAVYHTAGRYYDVAVGPRDLDLIKTSLHEKVALTRYSAEQNGMPYTFSDGEGTIQTRDEVDIRNVQAQVLAALILSAQGVTAAAMTFRDAENVTHAMTPTEVMTMGMTVSANISALYQVKWEADDAIDKLTTVPAAIAWNTAN